MSKWTGDQSAEGYELLDFSIHRVSTLPLPYDAAWEGRPIFVTSAGPNYGLWIGGKTTWERVTGGGGTSTDIILNGLSCPVTVIVQDVVYMTGANSVDKALASNPMRMPARGVVITKPSATTCDVLVAGTFGFTGPFTPNGTLWVSDSIPGLVTTVQPALLHNVRPQALGFALSGTVGVILISENMLTIWNN